MNSIRPLATITLLACVGVFLYMEINKSEPVLPEELGEWSSTLDVETDLGGELSGGVADQLFTSEDTTATQSTTPPGGAAPAWTPPPVDSAPSADADLPVADVAAVNTNTSSVEGMPEVPNMPDLPPLGDGTDVRTALPADVAAPAAAALAEATTPSVAPIEDSVPPVASPFHEVANPHVTQTPGAMSLAEAAPAAVGGASAYSAASAAIEAALDRKDFDGALTTLTQWYGDPSLTPAEKANVDQLLSQLAGTVIYSRASHIEPPYVVRAGENLQDIADRYNIPWQLLAKINGVTNPSALQPGQELKVVKGPFSALVDMSRRELTLMLDRRYAGRFAISFDPSTTVEEGAWMVDQKLLTPVAAGYSADPTQQREDRSLVLTRSGAPGGQVAIVRGPEQSDPVAVTPTERVIRLKKGEVVDVYDILSVGSNVVIRR